MSGLLSNDPDGGTVELDWILDALLSPLAIVDRQLRFVAVNVAYCLAGGRTRSELVGAGLFDVFPDNPLDPDDTRSVNARPNDDP